jgi:hypothetical protein
MSCDWPIYKEHAHTGTVIFTKPRPKKADNRWIR